jgi:hypothetical protein
LKLSTTTTAWSPLVAWAGRAAKANKMGSHFDSFMILKIVH